MIDRRHFLKITIPALALLASCDATNEIAPTITDIEAPADALTSTGSARVTSRATVDRKGWGYAKVYFTWSPDPDSLFDNSIAGVVDADCGPASGSILACAARPAVPVGTWYFQWHLDYGASGANTATLSRPISPAQTFTITQVANTAPPQPVGGGTTPVDES